MQVGYISYWKAQAVGSLPEVIDVEPGTPFRKFKMKTGLLLLFELLNKVQSLPVLQGSTKLTRNKS